METLLNIKNMFAGKGDPAAERAAQDAFGKQGELESLNLFYGGGLANPGAFEELKTKLRHCSAQKGCLTGEVIDAIL